MKKAVVYARFSSENLKKKRYLVVWNENVFFVETAIGILTEIDYN